MQLLIDIGNSALKWQITDAQGQVIASDKMWLSDWNLNTLAQVWASLSDNKGLLTMWIASVAKPHYVQQLKAWAGEQSIALQQVSSQTKAKVGRYQLTNGYQIPSQLGVDRWLAMLAVMTITKKHHSFCVIDCGSATTVDYVTQTGQHLGGYIMPGQYLMNQSLISATEQIKVQAGEQNSQYPTDTSAAVLSGVAYMHCNTMRSLIDEAVTQGYQVYVTGGANHVLVKELLNTPNEVTWLKDLVLYGLNAIAQDKVRVN